MSGLDVLFIVIIGCYLYVQISDIVKYLRDNRDEKTYSIEGKNGVHYYKAISKLTGREFEELIAFCFEQLDYVVKLTPHSHDYGADILLYMGGHKVVAQVKRWKDSVGVAGVREAIGAIKYYNADRALVITNSTFTRDARKLAYVNQVELWDRDQLIELLLKAGSSKVS